MSQYEVQCGLPVAVRGLGQGVPSNGPCWRRSGHIGPCEWRPWPEGEATTIRERTTLPPDGVTPSPAEKATIRDPCPACGAQSLFLGEGGWLTCGVVGCKSPAFTPQVESVRGMLMASRAQADTLRAVLRLALAHAAAVEAGLSLLPASRSEWAALARTMLGEEGEAMKATESAQFDLVHCKFAASPDALSPRCERLPTHVSSGGPSRLWWCAVHATHEGDVPILLCRLYRAAPQLLAACEAIAREWDKSAIGCECACDHAYDCAIGMVLGAIAAARAEP